MKKKALLKFTVTKKLGEIVKKKKKNTKFSKSKAEENKQ